MEPGRPSSDWRPARWCSTRTMHPAGERPALSDAIQSLQDNVIVGDPGVVAGIGALAWIVAAIAAAFAVRGAGAPVLATVLLGLSVVVFSHPPPIGPAGLACFAGAVLVLYHSQRGGASRTAQTESPTPKLAADV